MIDWRAALEQVAPVAGDKRMALAEAVRRFVQPGMTLNPVALQARPVAALYELICRFAGGDPRLELVSPSLSGNYLQLVGAEVVSRAVQSFAGEGYPRASDDEVASPRLFDPERAFLGSGS